MSTSTLRSVPVTSFLLAMVVILTASAVSAWTGPTQAPPGGDAAPPINESASTQIKVGGFSAGVIMTDTEFCIQANCISAWPSDQWTTAGTDIYRNVGSVGIGTASPSQKLTVSGNVLADGYFHTSDARLKENIKTSTGLSIVEKLRGVTFDWKDSGKPSAGVIAQEVEQVLPSAVRADSSGTKSVDYDQLIGPMIEAIKEQQIEIEGLKYQIEQLKAASK